MRTFAFKTTIDALVRVQAADEDSARKAVPTVLAAPDIADIMIANENVAARSLSRSAGALRRHAEEHASGGFR